MRKRRVISLVAPPAVLLLVGLLAPCLIAQSSNSKSQGQGQNSNGNPNSSQSQNVGGGSGNGGASPPGIESYTLAYNGLRGDAIKIADRISNSVTRNSKIIILDRQTVDDLIGLQVAELQAESLKNQLCTLRPIPPGTGGTTAPAGGGGGSILGDVGSIISSSASLVQALTPDSTSTDADIKIQDEFLIAEEIAAIQRKHSDVEVIWPKRDLQLPTFDIANAPDLKDGCLAGPSADFFDVYRRLMAAYSFAQLWIQSDEVSADHKAALKSTMSRVESFRNELESSKKSKASQGQNTSGAPPAPAGSREAPAGPPGNGGTEDDSSAGQTNETTSPLIRFVRLAAFLSTTVDPCITAGTNTPSPSAADASAAGTNTPGSSAVSTNTDCFFLYLRMGQASGGTLVKKSFFHPTYYYYSGGAVASFAFIRICNAKVVKTGIVTTTTSYMREKTFQKDFGTNRRYDDLTDKTMDEKSDGNDEY